MRHRSLSSFILLFGLSLTLISCDLREGTIVYDVDVPRANANYGGGGSSSDGAGNTTATNDFGAGYRVSESGGSSSVTESGAGDTLTIRLVLEPLTNVTLALVSVDTGEVTLSTNTLTFTPDNWNVDQTVNLSAVEDGIADGDQTTTVTVLVTGSGDKRYASDVPSTDLSVTTVDSGTIISPLPPAAGPGITITQSGGSTTVTESGDNDTITVVLNEAPTDNVTVAINKSNNGEISASPATVTFTTSNWNVAQTVTVSAVEDGTIDGDKDTTFTVGVSVSNDSNYTAVADASVPVSVIDSGRVPGIVITSTGSTNQVSENGTTTDTITLVLNTPPSDNVTVTITDNDTDDSEVSYLPDNLTFTPSNWNVAQTVTLTAIEDYVPDNHQTTLLTMTSSSGDATNDNLNSTTEVLTVDSQTAGGITISQSSLTLSESGATDTLTFKLNTPPLGNVTISLTDNDTDDSEISYSPDNLTFDSSNHWNVAQTVTFSPLQDSIVDGDQIIKLDVTVSSVGDPTYGSAMNTNRTVTVNDSGLLKPVLDNITVGEQQLTIYWQAQSVPDNYTLYWVDNDIPSNSGNFTISNSPTSTSYVHGGLDSSLTYTYYLAANIGSSSSDNSTSLNNSPASRSCSPSYTPDTDSDLLVYYDFEGDLNDESPDNGRTGSDGWPYHLTNTGGTIRFAAGCSDGLAGYFDSTSGYAYNNNFNDDNNSDLFESGNFTISMWFYADQDMAEFSSLMSSKYLPWKGDDDDKWSFQLDDNGAKQIRWRSAQGTTSDDDRSTHTETSNTYSKSQWTHATFVKHDNGTSQIYLNGVLEATSSETQNTPLDSLRIGVNRHTDGNSDGKWKGYIDEFKVYGRALTQNEVVDKCLAYSECSGMAPAIPDNLTAVVGIAADQVNLSWNPTNGTDNYTVYWTDNASLAIDPDNASTYDNYTVVDNGTTLIVTGLTTNQPYDFTAIATNTVGSSAPAEEVTATPVSTFTLGSSNLTVLERNDNSTTFALQQQPNGNVTVTLSSADNSQATISPTTLTFSSGNYSVGQTITLTGVEDFTVDNTATVTINVSYDSTDNSDLVEGLSSSFTIDVLDSGTVPPVIDNATPSEQQMKVYWQSYSGADNFTLYWTDDDNPQNSGNFTVSSGSTSYVHGGLDSSRTYTYQLAANIGAFSGLSNSVSNRPNAFVECDTTGVVNDPDADLLVYYPFNGNMQDQQRKYNDSRYDLVNMGGALKSIKFPQGCGQGLAGYFDSTSGWAENTNFNDDNESLDNFTISMWVRPDEDMTVNASILASADGVTNGRFQISDDGSGNLIASTNNRRQRLEAGALSLNTWLHVTAVKQASAVDHGTLTFYLNGELGANTMYYKDNMNPPWLLDPTLTDFQTAWDMIKLGINRVNENSWKGYIDEVRVYGRALTANEVLNKCHLYEQCSATKPAIPDNLTVGLGSTDQQLSISWNATNGTDNYTIYWVDNSTTTGLIDPDNASTYDNFTVVTGTRVTAYNLTAGQTYNFTVVANNSTGSSAAATEASGSPAATFTLSPSHLTVVEGTDNTTGFALIQQPNGNVTVTFTSADTSEVTISPTTLLFTGGPSGNYSSSQTITLTGVQDYLPSDGDKPITINLSFDSTDNSDEVEGLSSSFTVTSVDSNIGLSAPGGLSAVVPTTIAGQVNLSWSGSSENIDNYTIYWTDNTSLTSDPDNASTYLGSYTTTSTSPTSYSVTNLTNSLQHGFTLVANNSGGRSPVATPVNATPLVPTPSGLSTTVGMGTGQVDLSWSAVSGADNYTIYISTDNITFNPLSPAVTGTSYSSTTLDNGTALSVGSSYSYYIVANGGGGSSANSTIVSATPVVANVVRSANGLRFNDVELYPDGSAVATGEWVYSSTGFTTNAPYSLGNLTVSNRGFMVAKTENGDWSWVWQPDQGHRGNYNADVYRGFLVSELAALPDGSVLMAGRAEGGSGGFKANDKSGNTITYPCIDDGDGQQDYCATNAFVGKLDKDGKLLWASSVAAGTAASGLTGANHASMNKSAHSAVEAIALAPDGGSFVLGWLQHYTDLVFPTATDNVTLSFANYSLSDNNKAAFLGKLDSAGNWVWVKLISGNTHNVNSVKGKSTQKLSGDGYAIETGPGPNLLDVSPDGSVVIAIGSRRPSPCYPGCTDNYTVIFGDPSLGDNFTFTEHRDVANMNDKIIIAKFLDNGSFAWGHDTGVYYQSGTSSSGVHVHALRDNSTLLVNYRDDNVTIESKVSLKKLAGDGTVVENQEPNFYLASQQTCSSGGFNNAVKVDQGRMGDNGNPAGPLTCHSMAVTPDESAIWLMCEGAWNYPMGMFKFDISSNFGTRLSGRNIKSQPSNRPAHWGDFSSVLPDGNAAALISILADGSTPLTRSFTIDSYDSSGCKVAEQTYQNTEDFSRESFLLRFNTNDNGSWTNWSPVVNTPSVPQNLTATQGATGEIQLNWDAVSRNELASYEIYRRDLGGFTTPTVVDLTDNKISVSPSNHLDSSLTSGSYFNYAVRAVNLSDNSSLSSPVDNVQAP